ncbi:unnamed protein product [Euphydryas editha]|uniref:Uncharacterized protein n=1 Tax=Euphydryas editha TaxID=104508 RepID=A0AAU9TBC9_EUPED|nr:unnamed protein product [Euphydryas editha]
MPVIKPAISLQRLTVHLAKRKADSLQSLSGDLANVLDAEKIMEGTNSRHLREFFKKLIETDAQIRKLKQTIDSNYLTDVNSITDRFKRSLRIKHKHNHKKPSQAVPKKTDAIKEHDTEARLNKTENKKSLKTSNASVIIEEKILIKYEPERKRNFPKCSHTHETKHHEKKLKHPFYKNSQRIDEMLDTYKTFDDKDDKGNLNKILVTEKNDKENSNSDEVNAKAKNTKERKFAIADYFNNNNDETFTNQNNTNSFSESTDSLSDVDYDVEVILATTPEYDVALRSSTSVNAVDADISNPKHSVIKRIGQRNLMQVDDEDDKEDLVYEDLREILTDEGQSHDDLDKPVDRSKRNYKHETGVSSDSGKYSPQNINNPNWKGPMPLYPDELNAMIKHAALENLHHVPINTKDTKNEKDRTEKDVSDTEYIEDYTDNKYNKMVKMAQAYSDYGVLYDKKDKTENLKVKDENNQENAIKISFNKDSLLNKFFGRPRKGSCEGISIQAEKGQPPNAKEEFVKSLQKHIKIVNFPNCKKPFKTMNPINSIHTICSSTLSLMDNEITPIDKHIVFTSKKGTRSLKSIDLNAKENGEGKVNVESFNDDNNNLKKGALNEMDGGMRFLTKMSNLFKKRNSSGSKNSNGSKKIIDKNQLSTYSTARIQLMNRNSDDNYTINNLPTSYDSIGVSNVGHKSRVLMAIEDKPRDSDNIVPIALVLARNDKQNYSTEKGESYNNLDKGRNKTIVKRNSEGHESVFWNDFYDDDEYGIKIDYSDTIRNKHCVKNVKNIVQQSKDWFKRGFKNLTRKIKGRFTKKTTTTPKKINITTNASKTTSKQRFVRQTNNNGESDIKKSFADLTANMKKVFQEAAKAVQDTKNIEVREESKEDSAATSLMKRLVRLMTDLVDIQVEQKSCAKLPTDLHKFLEWLTVPDDKNVEVDEEISLPSYTSEDDLYRYEKSTFPSYDLPLTEDTHEDDRTECLGTIRAVQDLIQQYEGMSDEDKSKMTGVKDYLENQLDFLNKKLSGVDEANLYKLYDKREAPRVRRDLLFKRKYHKQNQRERRKVHKFIKNFVKKRTKSTASTYNGVPITKAKKNSHNSDEVNKLLINNNSKQEKRIVNKIDKIKANDKEKVKNYENKEQYNRKEELETKHMLSEEI